MATGGSAISRAATACSSTAGAWRRPPSTTSLTIRLGADGPLVVMEVELAALPTKRPVTQKAAGETMLLASYAERYFGAATDEEPVGGRTMMIRKAFHSVQKKQKRLYRGIVAVVVAGGAERGRLRVLRAPADGPAEGGGAGPVLHHEVAGRRHRQRRAADGGVGQSAERRTRSRRYLERRRQMESNYDRFLSGLNVYDHTLTAQEQLILRVTRLFGECEMAAPPEYLAEVSSYIRKWQGSGRYARAVTKRAGDGLHEEDRRGVPEAESAAAVLLSGDAGKRLQRGRQRSADPHGNRQGHVAVHSGDRRPVRAEDRTAGGVSHGRTRSTIGTSGRRPPAPRPATSRTSIPPTRRRQGCW